MTSEVNTQVAVAVRAFGENLVTLRQPQWGAAFSELAVAFENAATDDERSRLAEQGLAYFSRSRGLDDWLKTLTDMPDKELYRILEANRILTRELLLSSLEPLP